MAKINIYQTKNVYDYKPLLDGLFDDFGYAFYDSVLEWCNVVKNENKHCYWSIYVISYNGKIIGVCGLYSYFKNYTEELWLGWLGIIPKYRNKKIGGNVLSFLESTAKSIGCKKILSFVYKEGAPLNFYYRNGFVKYGSVRKYLKTNKELDKECFDSLDDIIIQKELM